MASVLSSLLPGTSSASSVAASSSASPTSTPSPTSASPTSTSAPTSTSSSTSAPSSATSTPATSTSSASSTATSATPTTSSSTAVHTTTSGGSVVTETSVVITTTTPTSLPGSPQNDEAQSGFFHNKPAVIGVFTAVGVVAAVLLVIIGVTIYRRRRASRFDKDVAEAAAAAAASSRSPFDDDMYADRHGPGNPYNSFGPANKSNGYSDDHSHGTFAQPPMQPMSTGSGSHPMSEYSHFDPYVGRAGDPYTAGAAALGAGYAGVGAASNLQREPSKRAPYGAFAGPHGQEMMDNAVRYGGRGNNGGVLEAVGLGGSGAASMARRQSGHGLQGYSDYPQQQQGGPPQQHNQGPGGYGQGGFQDPYPPRGQNHYLNNDTPFDPYGIAHAGNQASQDRAPSPGDPLPNPHGAASQQHVPYVDEPENEIEQGHDGLGEEHGQEHEHELEPESDEEDERSARVLKVANA